MIKRSIFNKNCYATLAAAAALAAGAAFSVAAGGPSTQPSTQPTTIKPTTPETKRELRAIIADFQANGKDITAKTGDVSLGDAAKRNELAPELIPLFQKQSSILDELSSHPREIPPAQLAPMKQRTQATLYLLADPATVKSVDAMATADDKSDQQKAKQIQFLSKWMGASDDAGTQATLADEMVKMDEANPSDSKLTSMTYSLTMETKDKATKDKLNAAVLAMKTPMAKALAAQIEGAKKLASLEGKPLAVAGKTPEGKDFTTADWKGKVVLVDFWATWCPPCRAELPRVKQIYTEYHPKGLEILSVSNDYSTTALTDFVAKNDMPWPELYDDAAGSEHKWNPITLGYGINGIPTMFLIDKKGVCRTVEARAKMEDMIPKLLAE